MSGILYSVIGFLAMAVHIIINKGIVTKSADSKEERYYQLYALSVFLYYLTDAAWGVFGELNWISVQYYNTVLYYVFMAMSVVFCCRYIIAFLDLKQKSALVLNVFGSIFFLTECAALTANHFWPIFFDFDQNGVYHAYLIRNIALLIQILLFSAISVFTVVASFDEGSHKARRHIICLFSLAMTLSLLLQYFFPLLPLYSAGLMLGSLILHIYVFQEDLKNRMEQISDLNKQLVEEKHTQQDYSSIMRKAGVGVWHIYMKKGVHSRMQCDETMLMLLGVADSNLDEEQLYDFWYDHLVDSSLIQVAEGTRAMMAGSFAESTYKWNHPTQGSIYVRSGGTALKLDDGGFVISGYHSNVTERVLKELSYQHELERAREEAEAASAAKTSFLFSMSHDIRTPMNAIIGFRDLLEKHQDDPVRRADYLEKIEQSSSILLSIINNVLEMARIEKGTIEVVETAWSAMQLSNSISSIFVEMMEQKHITFIHSVNVWNPYVFCDQLKLREVFINILSNAYKYTESGGLVNMRIEEIESGRYGYARYRTTISDSGMGMSEDFLPHLFDEFSREQNSTEGKIEGTGLGMSIVKRLVEMMGGRIEVKSKKGEGTTFIVTIDHPIATREDLVEHDDVELAPGLFDGKRILLAEDNDLNAEIATEILTEAGFVLERAENGKAAVEMVDRMPFGYYDVVLMDIQMPVMNGYDATRNIRSMLDAKKARIPIIAMTANAFEEDRRAAMRAGMDGHLAKPIDIPELLKTLSMFVC